jgi:hypothetical protein
MEQYHSNVTEFGLGLVLGLSIFPYFFIFTLTEL